MTSFVSFLKCKLHLQRKSVSDSANGCAECGLARLAAGEWRWRLDGVAGGDLTCSFRSIYPQIVLATSLPQKREADWVKCLPLSVLVVCLCVR
ncbi:hypothetical protein E2C01_049008 [Portunus trituberculatus]|uniref:Uncharacterized protein n=1 Tax=Portunus trituberculatus TaxID=210409 RepID=A0A5B7GCH7_PORTR|nr:hypothetical protein [Portunus trituberculatus]